MLFFEHMQAWERLSMIVSMWMTRGLMTIETSTPITEAAALMADRNIRRLPVVRLEEDGMHLLGLISASDLYRAFPPNINPFSVATRDAVKLTTTAEQIMSRKLVTVAADTPLEEAATIMRDRKIGALPVVRGSLLVGLITESDIFRAFISLFEKDQTGARITFDISNDEDVFALLTNAARSRKVRIASFVTSRKDAQTVCVARVTGSEQDVDALIESLWKSKHPVQSVVRW
jgi:acetoin utilization protein AcuB